MLRSSECSSRALCLIINSPWHVMFRALKVTSFEFCGHRNRGKNILCVVLCSSTCKRILFSIPAFRDRISGGRKKSSPRNTLGKPAWSEKVFREPPQKSRWIARLARKSIPVRVGTG